MMTKPISALAAAAAAAALSACSLMPAYDAPLVNIPERFAYDAPQEDASAPAAAVGWQDWFADPRMPVNMAGSVAKAEIPILLLYGGQDQTVLPKFNCEPFAERFKAAGGDIRVVRRDAFGHHPHGEEHGRTSIIADFLEGAH